MRLKFIFYRVLLVHGHWFYVRTATLVQYFFYKNLAAFTAQLIYACFNSFSTQPVYDVINLTMFNILYTSIPIFVYGLFTFVKAMSGSFLWCQLSIDNYHVKKYVKKSQFLLFSRQKVYKNAKFVYITEIL